MRRLALVVVAGAALVRFGLVAQERSFLPNRAGSLKFAAIGDNGTGDQPQYDVAGQMDQWHGRFAFDMVIMLGDNLYGSQRPTDFVQKFERPCKPLLDAGVKFYSSLGNHDKASNDTYQLFNMNGERYYSYVRNDVRFVVLDSNYLDPKQLAWLEGTLRDGKERWKIAYFHHPLYSDGGRHGSEVELRVKLEPLFVKYGVNVVYSGHDHIYERLVPRKGITYFVAGASGELRRGDLRPSSAMAAGFDQDRSFMLNEIVDDDLFFQVISRTGATVDGGVIHRQETP
jgi:calcineurin-like phosphoesterase family protein